MSSVLRRRGRALLVALVVSAAGGCAADPPRRVLDPPFTTVAVTQTSTTAPPPATGPRATTTAAPAATIPPATILPATMLPATIPPSTVAAATTAPRTTAPPTTAPPVTSTPATDPATTVALPTLAPDQQPATADEGRALLAMVPPVDLPQDLASLRGAMGEALQRVIAGGRPDEAFFDDVGSLAPTGVAVNSYLICPLAGNEKCAASTTDFARFVAKCGGARTYLFTSLVERDDGWAAAGTCVWVPTADEVAFATQAAANLVLDELTRLGQPFVRDPVLDGCAAAMAESAATHPQLGSAHDLDEFFAGRDAITAYAWNNHHGYGYFSVNAVSPAAISDGGASKIYARDAVDDYHFDGTAYVGIGTFFARGQLLTYYAIVT